jgi:tetratricopeptide (TPR) repeat protein
MKYTPIILALALVLSGCSGTSAAKKKDAAAIGSPPAAAAPAAKKDSPAASNPADNVAVTDDAPVGKAAPERPKKSGFGDVEVSDSAESALDSAATAMANGNYASARSTLEALQSDPKAGFLASYNLGVLADREGKADEAIGHFEESLRNNPDFTPSLVSVCRLYLRKGKAGLAVQTAERYVRQRPDNLDHVDAKLQVLLYNQRYEEVIREAKSVLRKDERNVRAMMNLAQAYHRLGKHELAESILTQVAEITEDDVLLGDVRNMLGFVYLALKDDFRARSSFEKALTHRPDHAEAHNNLGVLYHRARDYSGAAGSFERAVSLQPRFKEAFLNLGNAQKGSKDYPAAEKAFLEAIKIDSGYAPAYFNLGILYLDGEFDGRDKKEQFQLAIDNFNRYKAELKSDIPRDDPADQYVEEAKKKIEIEIKREEQNREALQGGDDDDGFDDEGDGSDEPGGDDDEFGDDPFGDEEEDEFGDDPFDEGGGDEEGDK